MQLDEKLYKAMVMDSNFGFAEKTEEFLKALPVSELLNIYNGVTEILNMEYGTAPEDYTEEQFRLMGKIFFDTSLDRYVEAFGEEWVRGNTKHKLSEELYITLHPFGCFITTFNHLHVTDKILDYLLYEDCETVQRVGSKPLTLFVTGLMLDYEESKKCF